MKIADNPPDIILITEVIPKAQTNPIEEARLNIPGFNVFLNFDPNLQIMSWCCNLCIQQDNATELLFDIQFKEHLWISIPLFNNDSLTIGCIHGSPTAELGINTESLYNLLGVVTES